MARSFLSLVQQAATEMNLTAPTQCIGSTDQQAIQLVSLANAEGTECAAEATAQGAWPALRKIASFTFVANQQSYDLPSDYNYMVYDTMWDATTHWRVAGPINPSGWNMLTYGVVTTAAPFFYFKLEQNKLWMYPTPTSSGDVVNYTYVSNAWCQSISGTPQTEWLADTDTYILDERLFILGLKLRFKQAKGLEYSGDYALYMKRMDWCKANSGVAQELSLISTPAAYPLLSWFNLPSGNYGA